MHRAPMRAAAAIRRLHAKRFRTRPTTTFYPGVDDATKAKSIKLSQSGVVQRIDFKLLP